ncbi:MAG: hypothetical protein ACKOWF_07595, partial [Chloroflexota bacterium]
MADRRVHQLAGALYSGKLDRRDFVRGMTALGVSATAINLFLKGAAAQDNGFATPDPAGLKPPVVAQPCEGDGCWGAGREITIQVIDASVKVPVDEVRAEFEAATGAKMTMVAASNAARTSSTGTFTDASMTWMVISRPAPQQPSPSHGWA